MRRNSFINCTAPREAGWPEGLIGKRRELAGEEVLLGRKSGMLSDCPSGLLGDRLLLPGVWTGAPCTV